MNITPIARQITRIRALMFCISVIAMGMCAFVAFRIPNDHLARDVAIGAVVAIVILLLIASSIATRLHATFGEMLLVNFSSGKDKAA